MEQRNFRPVVKDSLGIQLLSKDVKSKKKKINIDCNESDVFLYKGIDFTSERELLDIV